MRKREKGEEEMRKMWEEEMRMREKEGETTKQCEVEEKRE